MVKDILYIKNVFKNAKSITFYFILVYYSNCQVLLKINSTIVLLHFMLKLIAKNSYIVLDLG